MAGVFEPPECVRRQGDSRIHHTSSSGPQVSAQVSLRDAPVPGSDAQVPGGDAQVPLRDLAGEARRRGGHAAETLMGRVHQVALRYARGRLGRFGAEDLAQDAAQEVCMAVHTALPDYDERGAPFEAFAYTIASRKVARRGRAPALIRTLPSRQQEILALRVAVGLTTEETGAVLGMSAGSVRVTQHRALERLRHLLDLEARMP